MSQSAIAFYWSFTCILLVFCSAISDGNCSLVGRRLAPDLIQKRREIRLGRTVIDDAGAQREGIPNHRVGEIGASAVLHVDHQIAVAGVEIASTLDVAEAHDAERHRSEALEIVALVDERGERAREPNV